MKAIDLFYSHHNFYFLNPFMQIKNESYNNKGLSIIIYINKKYIFLCNLALDNILIYNKKFECLSYNDLKI